MSSPSAPFDGLTQSLAFRNIDVFTRQPNIFALLGVSRRELSHSHFLAWLFNPRENHGLKHEFLKAFLLDAAPTRIKQRLRGVSEAAWSQAAVRREWHHMDLVIEVEDSVCVIENKIGSGEHSNQLQRYAEALSELLPGREAFGVFLTVGGHSPSGMQANFFRPFSHVDLANLLRQIRDIHLGDLTPRQRIYLEDFDRNLQQHVMKDGPMIAAAHELWKAHAPALQFIMKHRPDPVPLVLEALKSGVRERGWELGSTERRFVRFLTPLLHHHNMMRPYRDGKGWSLGEPFLFEFIAWPHFSDVGFVVHLRFRTVLAPCSLENQPVRNRLDAILKGLPGASQGASGHWPRHFELSHEIEGSFTFESDLPLVGLARFWEEVEVLVKHVEKGLLAGWN